MAKSVRDFLMEGSLDCNSVESCNSNKIFATKERKEHIDKSLCCCFFAIFALFCGNRSLVAAGRAGKMAAADTALSGYNRCAKFGEAHPDGTVGRIVNGEL